MSPVIKDSPPQLAGSSKLEVPKPARFSRKCSSGLADNGSDTSVIAAPACVATSFTMPVQSVAVV